GVLVMVFEWGWGAHLIGLESTVPILSFIPLFMFAILFGLSMDYEVFLLSRVRGEFDATGDNGAAVVRGLAGTARTITSATLIMVAVFGGFVLGDDPLTKMMGLGLATAIAVDATVVRLVLVPATMTLLGRANWWLPPWLGRLLPARVELPDDEGPVVGGPVAAHPLSERASATAARACTWCTWFGAISTGRHLSPSSGEWSAVCTGSFAEHRDSGRPTDPGGLMRKSHKTARLYVAGTAVVGAVLAVGSMSATASSSTWEAGSVSAAKPRF